MSVILQSTLTVEVKITHDDFCRIAENTTVNGKSIVFDKCGDIHPFNVVFKEAETVVYNDCDKNFVYYWLKQSVLPSVKHVYLISHPCEPEVFYRWENTDVKIYVDKRWERYVNRLASKQPNIIILPEMALTISSA